MGTTLAEGQKLECFKRRANILGKSSYPFSVMQLCHMMMIMKHFPTLIKFLGWYLQNDLRSQFE